MNFGFRYHLASLLAVFFSLVLGILIGGALFQDSALVEEQGLLISSMEERFSAAQASLKQLQGQLKRSESAWLELRDAVLPGRLQAETVVVVTEDGAKRPALDRLETSLRLAGAELKSIKSSGLAGLEAETGEFFVFWLDGDGGKDSYSPVLRRLKEQGASLAFVWGEAEQPARADFAGGLRVGAVDTILGEIALVLGLSSKSEGDYGLPQVAEALFP
ncbi:MAG TPA: copper transporter [Firmicutes bacterium]|nr:copper transporter [Bacillota bacterium]